jgi:hypothetical protein
MQFKKIELGSIEDEHPWAGETMDYPCNKHESHPITIVDWLPRWADHQDDDTVIVDEGFVGSILRYFTAGFALDDMVVIEYDPEHHEDHMRLASQKVLAGIRREVSLN